jgi:hypothetical protein
MQLEQITIKMPAALWFGSRSIGIEPVRIDVDHTFGALEDARHPGDALRGPKRSSQSRLRRQADIEAFAHGAVVAMNPARLCRSKRHRHFCLGYVKAQ